MQCWRVATISASPDFHGSKGTQNRRNMQDTNKTCTALRHNHTPGHFAQRRVMMRGVMPRKITTHSPIPSMAYPTKHLTALRVPPFSTLWATSLLSPCWPMHTLEW